LPRFLRPTCAAGWWPWLNSTSFLCILLPFASNYLIGSLELGDVEWRWMLGVEAFPAALFLEGAPEWEILLQVAGPVEVILSKRNELGLLSNFAAL
jgi:hypothetical protein